MSYNFRKRG